MAPVRKTSRIPSVFWTRKLCVQAVALTLGLLLTAAFLWIRPLLPFFLALGLAYVFSPVVDRLETRGVPRWAAALGLLGLLLLLLGLLAAYVLPTLIDDAQALLQGLPNDLNIAAGRINDLGQRFGLPLPSAQAALEGLRQRLAGLSVASVGGGMALALRVWLGVGSAVKAALNLVLVPFLFFFLLRDLPRIRHAVFQLVPVQDRDRVLRGYRAVDAVLAGYLRGQLILAAILGTMLAAGLVLLGVKFGLLIGLLTGLLNLIPYIGQLSGASLALVMGLVDFQSWGQVLAIPLLFGGMNLLEGTFITPRVVGRKVGLSPVETLLALVVGGELAGLVGLLIAVPLAGVLKLLLTDLARDYRNSAFYRR